MALIVHGMQVITVDEMERVVETNYEEIGQNKEMEKKHIKLGSIYIDEEQLKEKVEEQQWLLLSTGPKNQRLSPNRETNTRLNI